MDFTQQLGEHFFRESAGKIRAVLMRTYGDQHLDHIMDIVQDTFEIALKRWKYDGLPRNPEAWLMCVAKNSAINSFKRLLKTTYVSPEKYSLYFDQLESYKIEEDIRDAQLELILLCCNRCLSQQNQLILTLHVFCGFGVKEIASACFMKEEAVKKSLTRMKKRWREQTQGSWLAKGLLGENMQLVLVVLYLMFNEGYKTTNEKNIINIDLCYEAVRIAQLLLTCNIEKKEDIHAFLALCYFNIARFPARQSSDEIIDLITQDRSKWDCRFIKIAYEHLEKSVQRQGISRYYIEALISSIHSSSASFSETAWDKIVFLYQQLEMVAPSLPVTLSKIIARSYALDTGTAISELYALTTMPNFVFNFQFFACEGDLLTRMGKVELANIAYKKARDRAISSVDKDFLANKIKLQKK